MSFTLTSGEIIAWIIIGLLSGWGAGALLTRRRRGFGLLRNLVFGLVGAFVGGILFNIFNIAILPDVAISLDDLISGLVGAMVVVLIVRFTNWIQGRRK